MINFKKIVTSLLMLAVGATSVNAQIKQGYANIQSSDTVAQKTSIDSPVVVKPLDSRNNKEINAEWKKTIAGEMKAAEESIKPLPPKSKELQDELNQYSENELSYDAEYTRKVTLEKELEQLEVTIAKRERENAAAIPKLSAELAAREGEDKVTFKRANYFVYIVNLDSQNINLHWKDKKGKPYSNLGSAIAAMQEQGSTVFMATNGGMYTPTYEPDGLFIENGTELEPWDSESNDNDNLHMKPNGAFYIDEKGDAHIDTSSGFTKKIKVLLATQSGPMLIVNNKWHPKINRASANKKIRSGVGIINSRKVVFAISIDPVNFYDFATFFRNLYGCSNALYLDGAISKMYLLGLNPSERGGDFGPIITVSKIKKQ